MNMEYKAFKEEEIPYGVLSQFGLTREMVEDLPMETLEAIQEGRLSPVLPISVRNNSGDTIKSRARFKLSRQEDGKVDILFYPQLKRCDLSSYKEKEQEALLSGGAIVSVSPEDETIKCFVQIDTETNHVMYVPTPVIGRNLRTLMESFGMKTQDILKIQNGEPVSFTDGEELVTAGIDLNDRTGVRIEVGDVNRWRKHLEPALDEYNFGLWGCWIKDDEGNLSYVPEEDYSDEILAEQQKVIERNSGFRR